MNFYRIYNENSIPVAVHILFCIIAVTLWLLVSSIIVPFLFVFNIFKWSIAAWIVYKGIGRLISSEDIPYIHESDLHTNVNVSVFIMNGEPNLENLRKLFYDRVVTNNGHPSYKRLQQTLVLKYGRYVWTDEENFDISQHLILYDGPLPLNEAELKTMYGKILSTPIPQDMSPWQILIIPMKNKDCFALFNRVHHIIGDGISVVHLFSKVMDGKPLLLKPSEKAIKKYESNAYKRILHALFNGPLSLLFLAFSSSENPFPQAKSFVGETKVAWTNAISLPKIKEVKNKIGEKIDDVVTINDVVTGCFAGALRQYIMSINGKCTNNVQIAVSLNTRSPALLLKEHIPLGNNATGVLLDLPIKEKTVLERVKQSKKNMDVIKRSSDFLVFGFIFNQVIANVPEFIGKIIINSINRHTCLIMSNVPGPLNKMVIGGNEVQSIMVWPPLVGGSPLTVGIFSYADTIRLNVKVNSSIIQNPDKLADYFQMEVDELFDNYCKKDE